MLAQQPPLARMATECQIGKTMVLWRTDVNKAITLVRAAVEKNAATRLQVRDRRGRGEGRHQAPGEGEEKKCRKAARPRVGGRLRPFTPFPGRVPLPRTPGSHLSRPSLF